MSPLYAPTAWAAGVTPLSQANLNNLETQNDLSIREEGSHLAEQTTTNVAATSLSTLGGLTIETAEWIMVFCEYRIDAGHASAGSFGLQLNATNILVPDASVFPCTRPIALVESGVLYVLLGPREANYLDTGIQWVRSYQSGVSGFGATYAAAATATQPNAQITDITVRGLVANGLNTIATKNLYVYTFGG